MSKFLIFMGMSVNVKIKDVKISMSEHLNLKMALHPYFKTVEQNSCLLLAPLHNGQSTRLA